MRVIDAFNAAVHALAVAPDGRFLAAASDRGEIVVWDWMTAAERNRVRHHFPAVQLAFAPDSAWWAAAGNGPDSVQLHGLDQYLLVQLPPGAEREFAGGVAFAPDGKHLVISEQAYWGGDAVLSRWTIPGWKPVTGFDYWPPFRRLVFSPDGQYLAGINPYRFELRIAVTGGLNGWGRWVPRKVKVKGRDGKEKEEDEKTSQSSFLTFSRDSQTFVAGWDEVFHVLDTVNGYVRHTVRLPGSPVRDAAFTGSGRHLGTVDRSGTLKLWDAEGWQVVRAYDWRAGPLTRVAFTADGLAGVCGTEAGQLIVFDLDE
jgi:WD40 repeat protein